MKPSVSKWIIALIAAFIVTTATSVALPNSGDSSLRVEKIDTSHFPQIKMFLGLATKKQATGFKVWENGREVKDISVSSKASKQPVDVTLLIDVSGSMKDKPLDDAKAAAKVFIERARPDDRIAIVTFSSIVTRVADFTHDKVELVKAIDELSADGETAVYDALFESLGAGQNTKERRQNFILLSDGADTASKISGEAVSELAGKSDIPVSVITLQSSEFDPRLLEEIAERSNGRLLNVLSSEALVELYDSLAAELHNRYQIVFKSRANKTNVGVKIEAVVGGQSLQTIARLENLPRRPQPVLKKTKATVVNRLGGLANPWLAIGLGFLAAFLLVIAFANLILPSKNTLSAQLKYYDQLRGRKVREDKKPVSGRAYESLIDRVRQMSARHDFTSYSQQKLEQAGLPVKPHEYIAMHLLIVVGISLSVFFLTGSLVLGLLLIALAVIVPLLAIQIMIERRKRVFGRQLPDTLDMLASSMRAGYGLQQAIVSAGDEARQPTGAEFKRVANQTQMGMPLEDSLKKMAARIGNSSFKWVVLSIAIHRETGGNLAEILDNLSASLRERESMRRQLSALTAEGRLSAIILIILPVVEGLLLAYMNPSYMSLLINTLPGVLMLTTAIVLMAFGGIWLKKITNIEY